MTKLLDWFSAVLQVLFYVVIAVASILFSIVVIGLILSVLGAAIQILFGPV